MPLQDHTVSPAIQQVYRRLSCRGEVGLAVTGETDETCTPPIVLTQGTIEVYETSHHLRGTQNEQYYYYTHLPASFPFQPGYAGTRKVKPVWIYMRQKMVGSWDGPWHQLDHMYCNSLQTDKKPHQHLITQLLQARCSS